jgi:hypothetical protein
VLFPPNPTLLANRAAQSLYGDLGRALTDMARALADHDVARGQHALQSARRIDARLDELEDALAIGRETARLAPLQRDARRNLARYGETLDHLDFAIRNTRVLARHALRYVRREEEVPGDLPEAIRHLGVAVWALAAPGEAPRRGGEAAELARTAVRLATSVADEHPDRATIEIVGQLRFTAADLIRVAESSPATPGNTADQPTEELLAEPPDEGGGRQTASG